MRATNQPQRTDGTSSNPATTLLKVAQVAERLNCCQTTVYSLVESGELEHHRCPGIRVSEEQLLAYLKRTKQGCTAATEQPKRTHPHLKHITLR